MKMSDREVRFFADPVSLTPAVLLFCIYTCPTVAAIGTCLGRGDLFEVPSILIIGWGLLATCGAVWMVCVHITAKRISGQA